MTSVGPMERDTAALAFAADITEIEQLLTEPPPPDGSEGLVAVQGLLRVHVADDRSFALASSYIRRHDPITGVVRRLGYGRTRLERLGDRWRVEHHDERPTGDPEGPGFLLAGLRPELYLTRRLGRPHDDRIAQALDVLAIRSLLVTYGMAADSGSADLVADLYLPDAGFDIEGQMQARGRAGIITVFTGPRHQSLMPWSAHTVGPGLVHVDGDHGSSTHYVRTYIRPEGQDRPPWRVSMNRWDVRRDDDGCWRVIQRTSRIPEGGQMATLAGRAVADHTWLTAAPSTDAAARLVIDVVNVEQFIAMFGLAIDSGEPDLLDGLFSKHPQLAVRNQPVGGTSALLRSISPKGPGVAHPCEPAAIDVRDDRAIVSHLISVYGPAEGDSYPLRHLLKASWELGRDGGGWMGQRLRLEDLF